jgi:tetratricopeptide (TPR) repeat protein
LAEIEFNKAISDLEIRNDNDHPHAYVDRARLFMLQSRYDEALLDLNKALDSDKLVENERIRGLVSRIVTNANLKMETEFLNDLAEFNRINPNSPTIEYTKDKIIIRNAPDCSCYYKLMSAFYIAADVCDSEEDIQILPSGICVIKRKQSGESCGCNAFSDIEAYSNNANQNVQNCNYWCDQLAIGAEAWCGNHFKTLPCQVACLLAVNQIKNGCYWCCSTGDFHSKCIEPFNDIFAKMD